MRTIALLVLTILCVIGGLLIAAGVIPILNLAALNVVLPLGAICFGFFVLSKCLENESDRFVEEQKSTMAATDHSAKPSPPATKHH